MKKLTFTICLTLAVLLGTTGTSWGADYQKGLAAFQSGGHLPVPSISSHDP